MQAILQHTEHISTIKLLRNCPVALLCSQIQDQTIEKDIHVTINSSRPSDPHML